MKAVYKILLIEDDQFYQLAFQHQVKEINLNYDYQIIRSIAEYNQISSLNSFDLIISEYRLSDGNIFDIFQVKIDIPVIILTNKGSEEIAVKAMKMGAKDYLKKDAELNYLKVLPLTVKSAIAAAEIEKNTTRLAKAVDSLPGMVFQFLMQPNGDFSFPFISSGGSKLFELESGEIQPDSQVPILKMVHRDDRHSLVNELEASATRLEPWRWEGRVVKQSGETEWIQWIAQPERLDCGDVIWHGVAINISDASSELRLRKQVEEQLKISQERYALAVSAGNVGVWDWNLETNEIYLDFILKAMLGYSDYDIANNPDDWYALVYKDDVLKMRTELAEHLQGHTANYESEYRMVHRNGEIRWFLARGNAIWDVDNKPYRITGTSTDITQRKLIEIALQESDHLTKAIFNNIPDMAWLKDPESKFIAVNECLVKSVNATSLEELIGKTDFDIAPLELAEKYRADDLEVIRTKTRKRFEEPFVKASGETIWIETIKTPIYNQDGEIIGIAGIARDLTERKQAELALKKANDELEIRVEKRTVELAKSNATLTQEIERRMQAELEIRHLNAELEQRVIERTKQLEAANQELESFSYSVSHDLRSPLRSIDGFSQALLEDYEDQLDEFGKDYLQRVRSAAQRMGELIDDLLEFSRISRGEIKQEQVDLSVIATEIATYLQQNHSDRQVEFIIHPEIFATGDGRLLRVVLENLLGNAWKYTSKHPHAQIEFGACVKNNSAQLTYFVRDDGAGFDMAYVDKLFGVFQRLHGMQEFEGTGIGLATVQRIIHRHGGQVWAEGAIEQGATFYFTISSLIPRSNHT